MSNNIASERVKLGLSREELGERMGVSGDVVRNWEDGKTDIKAARLCALAGIFNCSVDYLMGRCDDRISHLRMAALSH